MDKGNGRKESLKKIAYDHIKTEIIWGKLKPGDIISEKEFVEKLEISRTPVHEAVNALAQEGLVTIMPRRGTVVSPISVSSIKDMYEARSVIEPVIVRKAMENADEKELRDLKNLFGSPEPEGQDAANDIDGQFHRYLAKCAGNRFLYKLEEDLMMNSFRARALTNRVNQERNKSAWQEHIRIIDAILEKNEEKAVTEMLEHLKKSSEGYTQLLVETHYMTI